MREVFYFIDYFCLNFALWVTLKSIHPLVFSFVTLKRSTLYIFQHLNKMLSELFFLCGYIFFSVWRVDGESCMFHFLFLFIYCDLTLDGRNSEHLSLFGKSMAWQRETAGGWGCVSTVSVLKRLCVCVSLLDQVRRRWLKSIFVLGSYFRWKWNTWWGKMWSQMYRVSDRQ